MPSISQTRLNHSEYSRYGDMGSVRLDQILCRVRLLTPADGETLRFQLFQELNGEIVATKTLPVTHATTDLIGTIELQKDCWDQGELVANHPTYVYRARQGWYHLIVTLLDTDGVTVLDQKNTNRFAISIVTTTELRQRYGMGFPALANDVFMPVQQPKLVTGVTIKFISELVNKTAYQLIWKATAHTLQLVSPLMRADLPSQTTVIDPANDGAYILMAPNSGLEGDYITVEVVAWDLPTGDVSENLVFDNSYLAEDAWREYLWEATGWMESQLIGYLEPTRYCTDISYDIYAHKSDAPAVPFYPKQQFNWMNLQVPSTPLLTVDQVHGKFNESDVLQVPQDWLYHEQMGGLVQFVPKVGSIQAWAFRTSNFLQFVYGPYPSIPGFWHYQATVGLPDLFDERALVREFLMKRAMINILILLGTMYRGGVSAESTSKDGISSSISYTSSATVGVYGSDITQYREDIKEGLPDLKKRLYGVRMRVIN